jgi:tetratricopeptide (TPR) repeat protein
MTRRAFLLLCLASALAAADPNAAPPGAAEISGEILEEFRVVETLAAKSAYGEAESKVRQLLPRVQENGRLSALLLRNLAALEGLQKRYAQAAQTLERSLALQALPPAETSQAQFELGQYLIAAENYPKAAEALSAWLDRAADPAPEHYLLLAEVRSQLKQYAEAAALAEKAIAGAPVPKPEWRKLLLGLYHEAKNFDGCAKVLAELIQSEPGNLLYWNQLTGIYQEAGKESQALAVRQLMHARGLLQTPEDILRLCQILRYRGLPSRAAELLQGEIERGRAPADAPRLELLAESWTEAKELGKAAAAQEKAAALADAGDAYHRLGQLYSELREWAKARQALSHALAKGGLKNPGGAYLLLGLAHYKLDAKEQAREAFVKAQATPAVRNAAQQWLAHLDQEARRNPRAKIDE